MTPQAGLYSVPPGRCKFTTIGARSPCGAIVVRKGTQGSSSTSPTSALGTRLEEGGLAWEYKGDRTWREGRRSSVASWFRDKACLDAQVSFQLAPGDMAMVVLVMLPIGMVPRATTLRSVEQLCGRVQYIRVSALQAAQPALGRPLSRGNAHKVSFPDHFQDLAKTAGGLALARVLARSTALRSINLEGALRILSRIGAHWSVCITHHRLCVRPTPRVHHRGQGLQGSWRGVPGAAMLATARSDRLRLPVALHAHNQFLTRRCERCFSENALGPQGVTELAEGLKAHASLQLLTMTGKRAT